MSAAAVMKDGRAGWRALQQIIFITLCLVGMALFARGAVVPVKAVAAQFLLERAFDHSVAAGRSTKPWPWADTVPVARITVPRLNVQAIVLSGGSGRAMAFGPTVMPGTGEAITIMAAHRDTHFAFVRNLKVGDLITVQPVKGRPLTYRVKGFQTVRWDRFVYPRDPARPMLALATCWPLEAITRGPWRRVIWAESL